MTNCLLISDFNVASFAGYLSNHPSPPTLDVQTAPYGQVMRTLVDRDDPLWGQSWNALVVWTRPQAVSESFASLLAGEEASLDSILDEVDAFVESLQALRDRASVVFVPLWVTATYDRGLGLGDFNDGGVGGTLLEMNARLAASLRSIPHFYLLNTQKWIEMVGEQAFNPKFWYVNKMPFSLKVFEEATLDIKAGLSCVAGRARKLIVLDLDNTLWGGIVGDVGWQNLRLGGHDAIGEAFVDFQRALRALRNRGILLGIVSKNDESIALQAIRQNPEMVLREDDFAGWRINWHDKAQNLVELVTDLNLGLDSVVFIDDSPSERGRVSEALPDVLVPDWPADAMLFKQSLTALRCFDAPAVSDEDRHRTRMYVSDRERRQRQAGFQSLESWLDSLDLTVKIESLGEANLQRAVQLLNKTNQMNLTTRRMTQGELLAWLDEGERRMWCFRVADRYGDSGLTGLLSVEIGGERARIVDFVLSCRVFGRQIEDLMLHWALTYAGSNGAERIEARFIPTTKNKPTLDFWMRSGFDQEQDSEIGQLFCRHTSDPPSAPAFITVHCENAAKQFSP